MPNIEIHGFGRGLYGGEERPEQGEKIENKIAEFLASSPFAEYAVITICDTFCYSLKECAPFLRIYDTNLEEAKEIACGLMKILEIDIEIVHLAVFLPRPPFKLSPT